MCVQDDAKLQVASADQHSLLITKGDFLSIDAHLKWKVLVILEESYRPQLKSIKLTTVSKAESGNADFAMLKGLYRQT